MSELLIQSLWVTLLGMGLVFAAIVLFWGMMSAITAIPFPEEKAREEKEAEETAKNISAEAASEQARKAQAAAIAVAVALANQQQGKVAYFPMPETALVSAWQLGMRTRQMYQKSENSRR